MTETDRIKALRDEAGEAGDLEQYKLCTLAIRGDQAALEQCLKVLADAEAMGE